MCGIFFVLEKTGRPVRQDALSDSLEAMWFRGPDGRGILSPMPSVALGHVRLQVIGSKESGEQPMISWSGKTAIIFNGEIFNFRRLAAKCFPDKIIDSDTRLLLELYERDGVEALDRLEGMFAFVVVCLETGKWLAVRDRFGIKPLYYLHNDDLLVVSSEPVAVSRYVDLDRDAESLKEWRKFRRPCPGYSFYSGLKELLPGCLLTDKGVERWYELGPTDRPLSQREFEESVAEVIVDHLESDVEVTALLSGGIDSSLIALLTDLSEHYTVGLEDANEFADVREFCEITGKTCIEVQVTRAELERSWRLLASARQEPLSVPNEGLIYLVCRSMPKNTKVVLTGEGADELMFGYDRIFRYMDSQTELNISEFCERYCYSDDGLTDRMEGYIRNLAANKKPIEFCEDFFIDFHLPGLLRRMDSSMMSASKEGRVPFVDRRLFELYYRKPLSERLKGDTVKAPLRKILDDQGLSVVCARKKIGFSAKGADESVHQHYAKFQRSVLEVLQW